MKIAHIVHTTFGAGVVSALGDASAPIPREKGPMEDWMENPGLSWDFLGKDVSEGMNFQWPVIERAFRQAKFCYDWVHENRPDAILLWNDEYPMYRGAILAAKDLGIPTAELVHGNIHTKKLGHWGSARHCDWVLGATEEFRDWYAHYHPDRVDRVIVTGSVPQDPYAGLDLVDDLRPTSRFELNIAAGMPVVTFLTDAVFNRGAWQDPALRYQAALDFFKAFRIARMALPNLHLIVKVHPYEGRIEDPEQRVTAEDYQKVLKACGITDNYTIMDDEPIIMAVAPADLLVGCASSAMATGYHCGIPSLILGYEPFYDAEKHNGRGALVARDEGDLLHKLTSLLLDTELMGQLIRETPKGAEYFSGTEGKAAWRVAQAIKTIAAGEVPGEEALAPRRGETESLLRLQHQGGIHQRGLPPAAGSGPDGGSEHDPLAMG